MHITKQHQTSVTLFSRGGGVWRYASINEARRQLGIQWISCNVAEQFRVYTHTIWRTATSERIYFNDPDVAPGEVWYPEHIYREAEFIMRDGAGKPLTVSDFYHRGEYRPYRGRYAYWNGEGPVPGVRKQRGGPNRSRISHNINALRAAVTFAEEGEVPVRPKRHSALFADPYGDYGVYRKDRSWKKYRKTQWKERKDR